MQIEIAENAHHTKMYRNLHWRIYFYGQYHLYWSSGLTRNSRENTLQPIEAQHILFVICCFGFVPHDDAHLVSPILTLCPDISVFVVLLLLFFCVCMLNLFSSFVLNILVLSNIDNIFRVLFSLNMIALPIIAN